MYKLDLIIVLKLYIDIPVAQIIEIIEYIYLKRLHNEKSFLSDGSAPVASTVWYLLYPPSPFLFIFQERHHIKGAWDDDPGEGQHKCLQEQIVTWQSTIVDLG